MAVEVWVTHRAANVHREVVVDYVEPAKPWPVTVRLDLQPRTPEHGEPREVWIDALATAWTDDLVRVRHSTDLTYVPDVWVPVADVRRR